MTEPIFSPEQQILVDTYAGGDFKDLLAPFEAESLGDTLFLFLMRELGPEIGVTREEYIERLETAEREIAEVRAALL